MVINLSLAQYYTAKEVDGIAEGLKKQLTVEVSSATGDAGILKKYTIKQGGVSLGTIDIPKDFLLKDAFVGVASEEDVEEGGKLYGLGFNVGDKYLELDVNVEDGSEDVKPVFINIKDIAPVMDDYQKKLYVDENGLFTKEEGSVTLTQSDEDSNSTVFYVIDNDFSNMKVGSSKKTNEDSNYSIYDLGSAPDSYEYIQIEGSLSDTLGKFYGSDNEEKSISIGGAPETIYHSIEFNKWYEYTTPIGTATTAGTTDKSGQGKNIYFITKKDGDKYYGMLSTSNAIESSSNEYLTKFKTINGESVLGEGNIEIKGGTESTPIELDKMFFDGDNYYQIDEKWFSGWGKEEVKTEPGFLTHTTSIVGKTTLFNGDVIENIYKENDWLYSVGSSAFIPSVNESGYIEIEDKKYVVDNETPYSVGGDISRIFKLKESSDEADYYKQVFTNGKYWVFPSLLKSVNGVYWLILATNIVGGKNRYNPSKKLFVGGGSSISETDGILTDGTYEWYDKSKADLEIAEAIEGLEHSMNDELDKKQNKLYVDSEGIYSEELVTYTANWRGPGFISSIDVGELNPKTTDFNISNEDSNIFLVNVEVGDDNLSTLYIMRNSIVYWGQDGGTFVIGGGPRLISLPKNSDIWVFIKKDDNDNFTWWYSDSNTININQYLTKFKTINGESVLGEGNIEIQGGGSTITETNGILTDGTNEWYSKNELDYEMWNIPNSEIWYKTATGKVIDDTSGSINVTINGITSYLDSNTYEGGVGKLKFDRSGEITALKYSFMNIPELTSIKLPDSLVTIPNSLFSKCGLLKSLDLSNTKIKVASSGFLMGSTKLESVKLPDTIETIEPSFLSDCASLKSVDLSNTKVSDVSNSFLYRCTSVNSIKLPNTITSFDTLNLLQSNKNNGILYYPVSKQDDSVYQSIISALPPTWRAEPYDDAKSFYTKDEIDAKLGDIEALLSRI